MKEPQWIWLNPTYYPEYQKGQATTFAEKGDFVIARFEKPFIAKSETAFIEISADAKYRLWINDKLISIGPAVVGGDYANTQPLGWCFVDYPCVQLCSGQNKIVVEVQSVPEVMADYSSGYPGLYMRLTHGNETIVTDESWLAYPATEFPSIRTYDATRLIAPRKDTFASLAPRKIELLQKNIPELLYNTITPVKIIKRGKQTIYDFGKIIAGYIEFNATTSNPVSFLVGTHEVMERNFVSEKIVLPKGEFSYLTWRLHSFRYLIIEEEIESLTIKVHAPYFACDNEGFFRCSDENINRLFEHSLATLKLCRQTYHLDSPIHQESLGCTGDYYLESMMAYAILGEYSLSRLDIIRTAKYLQLTKGKMFHTSYTLFFLRWIREHYRYTADKELLKEVLPAIETVLTRFFAYTNGNAWLENPPDYMFIDWVPVDEFNLHHPPKALGEGALNALWYDALLAVSNIYTILGDDNKAKQIASVAQKIKVLFYEKLFDKDKGLFKAGTCDLDGDFATDWKPLDPSKKTYYSMHTNILAISCGLVDGTLAQDIFENIIRNDSLIPCQPYFYHFYFDACEKAGLFDKYAPVLFNQLLPICINGGLKEVFFGLDCDFSHAWGGTAVYQAVTRILGISPTSDGFTTYSTQPCLCNLTWAEGCIPTPWGKINIKVEKGKTGLNIKKTEIKL